MRSIVGAAASAALAITAVLAAPTSAGAQAQPPAPKAAEPKADPKGKAPAAAPQPKRDVGELQKQVDSGIAAFESGRTELAINQLSSAMSAGGLPSPTMARALYYRGAAYRKQGKPALAIADLTSALWLKGGLTDSDRKRAVEERSAAYRDAGLPDQTIQAVATRSDATADSKETTSAPASGNFFSSLFSGAGNTAAASSAAVNAATTEPAAPRPKAGVETASTTATAARPAPTAGWQTNTDAKAAAPAAKAAAQPQSPQAQAQAPKGWATNTVSSGGATVAAAPAQVFRVQAAMFKTREEALQLAGQLRNENAADLVGREAQIVETPAGSLGKVWRVRIGPFVDTMQAQALCSKVRNKGHDCMIVRD